MLRLVRLCNFLLEEGGVLRDLCLRMHLLSTALAFHKSVNQFNVTQCGCDLSSDDR